VQGANDNTVTVTLQVGAKIYNQDFFDYQPAAVSGTVYEDNDRDGVLSTGDTPLSDVKIELSNGMTATTNIDGLYQFDGLLPGSYTITEHDPLDLFSVADAQGANDNLISIVLVSGENVVEQFFLDQRYRKVYLPLLMRR
jgi:hypothetical protein